LTGQRRSGSGTPRDYGCGPALLGSAKREVCTVPSRPFILNAFAIEAALRHLAMVPRRLFENNVQTNAYDQNRPAAPRGFYLAFL